LQDGTNACNSHSRAVFATGVSLCSLPLRHRARSVAHVLCVRLLIGLSCGVRRPAASLARPPPTQQPGRERLAIFFCGFSHGSVIADDLVGCIALVCLSSYLN
jgi:hypothetical protein